MRDVFLDTYWLPLRVVAGLKWHLLWLAPFMVGPLLTTSEKYFGVKLSGLLLATLALGVVQWRVISRAINIDQTEKLSARVNTDFI